LKTIPLLLIILLSIEGPAQNITTDTSTTFFPNFKKGEKKTFKVVEESKIYNMGFVAKQSTSSYEMKMEVLDDSASFFIIQLDLKTVSSKSNKLEMNNLIAQIRNGLRLKYKIDKKGFLMDMVNFKEVHHHLSKAFDSLSVIEHYDSFNQAFVDQYKTLLNTASGILDTYLKPMTLYHTPYGAELVYKKPVYKASASLNAFNGKDIPNVVILELKELNSSKDFAQLRYDQITNKKLAALITSDKISEITKNITGEDLDKDELPDEVNLKDHNQFDMEISSGWITKARYKRIAKDGIAKMVNTMEITMQ
jgi:hypothetical protein